MYLYSGNVAVSTDRNSLSL